MSTQFMHIWVLLITQHYEVVVLHDNKQNIIYMILKRTKNCQENSFIGIGRVLIQVREQLCLSVVQFLFIGYFLHCKGAEFQDFSFSMIAFAIIRIFEKLLLEYYTFLLNIFLKPTFLSLKQNRNKYSTMVLFQIRTYYYYC